MGETVLHAIEITKRRQSANNDNLPTPKVVFATTSYPKGKQLSTLTFETLDVQKLNNLIKKIDKGWTMPKITTRMDPIGSNFQVIYTYNLTFLNIKKLMF